MVLYVLFLCKILMFCGSDLPSGTQMLQNDVTVHSLHHIRI